MTKKYILFDLDGTIMNSQEGILNCVKYALRAAKAPIPVYEKLLEFIGPPLTLGFQEITGLSREEAVKATAKYRERYHIIGLFECQLYEGIDKVLAWLKQEGYVTAIATSKPEDMARRILTYFKIADMFDEIVGATMDDRISTKDQVIQEVFRRLNITDENKSQVLMVGDRKQDMLGAKSCGLDALGVDYGFAAPGELKDSGADYIVSTVEELMEFFEGDKKKIKESPTFNPRTAKLSEMSYERIDFTWASQMLTALTKAQKEAASAKEQLQLHQEYYELEDHVGTMAVLAAFRHSVNTKDVFYEKENDFYDEELPAYNNLEIAYADALYESPYGEELEKNIGPVAFKNMELEKKATCEKIIPLQQEENKLVSEYEKLLSSASFDWEGESLSMAGLGKYMKHTNRNIRKKAWGMVNDFMSSESKTLDSLYEQLVKNRNEQALTMGYENYVTLGYYRMKRNCYDKEMVENFRSQVKKYLVPFVTKLQEERRQRLGVENLQLYDSSMYFKEGNPAPVGTPSQIMENGLAMYQELSEETSEFMKEMMKREMFDVLSKKNKHQGGYMEFIPGPRMPLVFANFNGTSGDVDVITHECGHAFQGYLAGKDDVREHWDITMETAETHSMSMEFFTNPWMHLFFGDKASDFKKMQLEDAICFIPYGCMVDEFQHIMYAHPEYSAGERHQVWKHLEKEYRPHLSFDEMPFFEKGGYWQRQHHIYSFPFYYIDYCIAETCALQYKIWMEKDYKQAWNSYLTLCKKSASGFFTQMIKDVGLESPFEDGTIKKLVQQLECII